jgi:hypothetical protein
VNPLEEFNEAVDQWMWQQEWQRLLGVGRRGKTAHLLARAAEGVEYWPYRLRMLGSSIGEGDKIRLRLLSGTSGLNSTLHHWREERASSCPWADCHNDEAKETVHHFCLECPHYHKLREPFREGLRDDCRCWPPKVSCSDFFNFLNDDER